MSFEDEHGSGSLDEALEMATFQGVKPVPSDDDDSAITFTWEGIGRWRFGYILPNFIFHELWMDDAGNGFFIWAVTEKLQQVIDRFSPDSELSVGAEAIQRLWLTEYLVGMGFERQDDTERGVYYSAPPARIQEWGEWVKNGAKPEEEPAWRVSLREAGLIEAPLPEGPDPSEPDGTIRG